MTTQTQTHTLPPFTLTDPIHDHKDGSCWTVPIFANQAESGNKLPCEVRALTREQARATAAFIVKCVNSHEALVETVKALIELPLPLQVSTLHRLEIARARQQALDLLKAIQ